MTVNYPAYTPTHLQYEYCPKCTSKLVDTPGLDGRTRPHCQVCQWTYYPSNLMGVHIVISTPKGVVFLVYQDDSPDPFAYLPGGSVEFAETPEEAAIRQAREQTGLVIQITRDLERSFDRDFPLGPVLNFTFEARAVAGALRSLPASGMRVGIFPEERFPTIEPVRLGSKRALEAYLQARKWSANEMPRADDGRWTTDNGRWTMDGNKQ